MSTYIYLSSPRDPGEVAVVKVVEDFEGVVDMFAAAANGGDYGWPVFRRAGGGPVLINPAWVESAVPVDTEDS